MSDNAGAHVVTISEFQLGPTSCVTPTTTTVPATGVFLGKAGTKRPLSSGGSVPFKPCAGKTPDGQRQSFQFPLYCGGSFSRNIPVEACTRAEALEEAQTFARSAPPNCVLIP